MIVNNIRKLMENITILEGDNCFLLTTVNNKVYTGDELCIIVNSGTISSICLIGSYVAHSGSNIKKLNKIQYKAALEEIIDLCDKEKLEKALTSLIEGLQLI